MKVILSKLIYSGLRFCFLEAKSFERNYFSENYCTNQIQIMFINFILHFKMGLSNDSLRKNKQDQKDSIMVKSLHETSFDFNPRTTESLEHC